MFRTWRSWGCAFELFSQPDGGGGGGDPNDIAAPDPNEHPDFDIDLDEPGGPPADDPAGQPPAGAPPARTVQPPSRRTPAVVGQDPRTPVLTPEQHQARYDALHTQHSTATEQLRQTQAQIAQLTRQVQALTGLQPTGPAADPAPPMNPRDKAAIDAIHRLMPWTKKFGENVDALLALPDLVKGFQTEAQTRNQQTAALVWDAFDRGVAQFYQLGDGQKLHENAQKMVDVAFMAFLENNAQAAGRFARGDVSLVKDFFTFFRTGVITPASRPAPSNQPGRRQPAAPNQPPRVPRGGPGATVVGQQPPQPNKANPDEVHDAAADAYFASR